MIIPWETILRSARAASVFLPPPANVVADLALVLAASVLESGCTIDGCPVDVAAELARTPIPTGEAGLLARVRAVARARGLG